SSKSDERWKRQYPKLPDTLYHYTSADGLVGMLDTGRIWATHAAFMNDPTELQYAAAVIGEALDAVEREVRESQSERRESFLDLHLGLFRAVPQVREWPTPTAR